MGAPLNIKEEKKDKSAMGSLFFQMEKKNKIRRPTRLEKRYRIKPN